MKNATQERILHLLRWLQEETNSQHLLSTAEILERWDDMELATDRRSVYWDVGILRKCGYPVKTNRGASNAYWMESERFQKKQYFSVSELGMLLDAVQSCRAISRDDTEILIHKLLLMASKEERDTLERPIYYDAAMKGGSKILRENMDAIFQAMTARKKIAFHRVYYKGIQRAAARKVLILSPYYMHYDREHYRVVGWSEEHGGIRTYRVDQVAGIKVLDQKMRNRPKGWDPDEVADGLDAYCERPVMVILRCDHATLPEVMDRYGDAVPVRHVRANVYEARVRTALSPQFSLWLALNKISMVNVSEMEMEDTMNERTQSAK